jgi:hypothetical protein
VVGNGALLPWLEGVGRGVGRERGRGDRLWKFVWYDDLGLLLLLFSIRGLSVSSVLSGRPETRD